MADLTPHTVLRRNADLLLAAVPPGYVLLDVEAARYVDLNVSAAAVWDLLETPTTLRSLCTALGARFDVGQEQCEAEVLDLLGQLLAWNVVRIVD
jgi:hypothetical protein